MLEGRHVIILFVLILLFSGVFFALGFFMGRGQYDGNVLADRLPKIGGLDPFTAPKPCPKTSQCRRATAGADSAERCEKPSNPSWDVHEFDGAKNQNDRLQAPASDPAPQRNPPAVVKNTSAPVAAAPRNKPVAAPMIPSGSVTLQVAALKNQTDAFDLATRLQKQKFPAFVVTAQDDKFFRVQVGPYADQKSVDAAKKGLDAAGFKAIVKH